MTAWREETARHARLAEELRLPAFEWYTPLWAATEAMLAGRYEDVERLSAGGGGGGPARRRSKRRACSPAWCASASGSSARRSTRSDLAFVEDKIANSPAGIAYRGGYTWILAGLGETERAREELHATMELTHAFDANWLSLQVELAEASVLHRRRHLRSHAVRAARAVRGPAGHRRPRRLQLRSGRPHARRPGRACSAAKATPSATSRMRSGSTTPSAASSGGRARNAYPSSSAMGHSSAEPDGTWRRCRAFAYSLSSELLWGRRRDPSRSSVPGWGRRRDPSRSFAPG